MQINTTVPSIYEAFGTQIYYIPYEYGSVIGPERWWYGNKERVWLFFRDYWSISIAFAFIYVFGAHTVQKMMKNRKPLELRLPLMLWNIVLTLFSLAGATRMGQELLFVLNTRSLLDSISYTLDPCQPSTFWAFCFAVFKLAQLGDTVFVVLRRKPLLFLHWFHHASALIYVWHSISEMVAGGRWFAVINYGEHALLYSYYAISAAGFRFPRILSMAITALQTAQMFIGLAISVTILYCKLQGKIVQQSFENLALCLTIYASFAVLFTKFFNKSYLSEKKNKDKAQ